MTNPGSSAKLPAALKKITSILIAFIYLATVAGVTLSLHHCQGNTSYTLLGITFNKTCKCPHANAMHVPKCCNNKTLVLQNYSDGFSPKQLLELQPVFKLSNADHHMVVLPVNHIVSNGNILFIESPPDIFPAPLHIINRTILI